MFPVLALSCSYPLEDRAKFPATCRKYVWNWIYPSDFMQWGNSTSHPVIYALAAIRSHVSLTLLYLSCMSASFLSGTCSGTLLPVVPQLLVKSLIQGWQNGEGLQELSTDKMKKIVINHSIEASIVSTPPESNCMWLVGERGMGN